MLTVYLRIGEGEAIPVELNEGTFLKDILRGKGVIRGTGEKLLVEGKELNENALVTDGMTLTYIPADYVAPKPKATPKPTSNEKTTVKPRAKSKRK